MATQVHQMPHRSRQPCQSLPYDGRTSDGVHQVMSPRKPTILVADDETHIVDFLSIMLEDEGYRVLRAYDGQQAWEAINRERPSLILSDVMMPLLGGVELVRRLRSIERFARVPVILMSAGLRQVPGLDVAFLPKPFDLDQVLRLVNVTASS
jgi:two-component system response regulator VicR